MSDRALDRLTTLQDGLVRALDSGDVTAIEAAIGSLAAAADEIRAGGRQAGSGEAARAALAANQAAQIRVNFLTDRIRRRLAAFTALREPVATGLTYSPNRG